MTVEAIDVGGARLRCELAGPEGGETVVLLNGIAMSIGHWKPVADALAAAGCRVLMHDLRGQLLSDKGGAPYSFAGHARDLSALLDALGIGPAHIVGTSYGSEVAMRFAMDYPARTRSLVLVDGTAEYDALLGATIEAWKAAALLDPVVFYRSILPWTYSAAFLAANRAALREREAALAKLPREYYEAFAGLCDAFLGIDLAPGLGGIRAPTLVLVGDADILKPPRCSKAIAAAIPGAAYAELAGAGHASVIEKPAQVAELCLRFVKGL